MNEEKSYIDNRIRQWFKIVEHKLRNSFQAAKNDNLSIKKELSLINKSISGLDSKNKNNDSLLVQIQKKLEELAKKIDKNGFDLKGIDIERIDRNIENIKNDFALKSSLEDLKKSIETKKQQKNDIKKQVAKELYDVFEKKIDVRFEKYSEKASEIRKDVASYRKSTENKLNEISSNYENEKNFIISSSEKEKQDFKNTIKQERKELKDAIELDRREMQGIIEFERKEAVDKLRAEQNAIVNAFETKKNEIIQQTNKSVSSIKKEISGWNAYFSSRLDGDLKSRDDKIESLQRQISYIKGRIKNGLDKPFVEEKPIEEEKGFFASILDSLSEDIGDTDKKPLEGEKKSVLKNSSKKKPTKDIKKLPKQDEKSFFSKIIDGLADKS
jgi:hypothetical protein